jgi:hypothetical protein
MTRPAARWRSIGRVRAAELLPFAADLGAARSQMAFTLGFHIVLACVGVALPALILIANYPA